MGHLKRERGHISKAPKQAFTYLNIDIGNIDIGFMKSDGRLSPKADKRYIA